MTYENHRPYIPYKWALRTSLPTHPSELIIQIEHHLDVSRGTLKALWGPRQGSPIISGKEREEVQLLRQFAQECVRLGFSDREVGFALGGSPSHGRAIKIKYGGYVPAKRPPPISKTPKPKPYNPAKDK